MKIGLILAQYNGQDYISKCLTSWIEYRKENDLLISCLDGRFTGFGQENGSDQSTDGSLTYLQNCYEKDYIDFLDSFAGVSEAEARNIALKHLIDNSCNLIFSIGVDEIFALNDINNIFTFVKNNPFVFVFQIHYKNLIWDNQYIEGFCPRRIWKVKGSTCSLKGFYNDDDCQYLLNSGQTVIDTQLSTQAIPKTKAFIEHHTWNNTARSIKKINYQNSRPGWLCSFEHKDGKIQFCKEYYRRTGQPYPTVFKM